MEALVDALKEQGIDHARIKKVLDGGDNFGGLVNAFEVVTVLGVVERLIRPE